MDSSYIVDLTVILKAQNRHDLFKKINDFAEKENIAFEVKAIKERGVENGKEARGERRMPAVRVLEMQLK